MLKLEKSQSKVPNTVKSFSVFLLILVGVVTCFSFLALQKLETQYSLKQFLPRQNPLLEAEEKSRQKFFLAENQPFVVTLKIKSEEKITTWFLKERISTLETLTQNLGKLSGVKNTLSLATVQGAVSTNDSLTVGPFLASLPESQWASATAKNSILTPNLISEDGTTASILVYIQDLNSHQITDLKAQIETATHDGVSSFATAQVGGTPAVQSDVGSLLQSEVRNFVGLGFLTCLLVLFLIFANFTPVFSAFIITLCANFIALGAMAVLGYSFTVLSTTIPILVTVTVVSLCIHTMLRVIEEVKTTPQENYFSVVLRTLKVLIGTNFLASLTPAIGFLSLLTTDVPLIRDYGLTVAMSIMLAWLSTTLLLYPLLLLLPAPQARNWALMKARWGLLFFRLSRPLTIGIVIFAGVLAFYGQNLSWSARLFDDLPENHQVRKATETIDKVLGGMIPVDIEITGSPDSWNEPQALGQLDALAQKLRSFSGVGSVMGLPDLVMAANLGNSRLPASRAATAEVLFLYSMSAENPAKNFLTTEGTTARLSLRTQDLPANELQALLGQIETTAQEFFPQNEIRLGGMGATIHELNNSLSRELIFGFWHAMGVIGLLLVVVFRSLRWALVACLPNLVPPAALLGFLALTDTPIKPSVAIIFSIALGMAFNNTIYFLGRLRFLQKKSANMSLDVRKTLWLEGNPCLMASITLIAGFSVFMISYFAMNRIFGFYMLLSMLAALVGDLILLPSLIKSCPWLLAPLSLKKEKNMITATAASILFALTLSFPTPSHSQNAITVEKIGQEIASRLSAKDESLKVKMKIIEADASAKEREMSIQRLSPSKAEHYMMVRMQKPQDLKGTALLATFKDGKEEKWLYLPSSKQTRRLSGDAGGQGGILGSELTPEDFDFNSDRSTKNTLQKEIEIKGKKYYVVESDVNASSNSYSKVVSFISAADFLPIKSECFDKKGQLLKTIDLLGYKKLAGNKYRASKIVIKNVQNKRSTEITLADLKINQGLSATKFTSKALAED